MNTSDPTFTARPNTIPESIIEVIQLVQQAAHAQGIEFVMVGATARVIVLQSVFGLNPGRHTVDLDFGFAVETWEQFVALKSALVATGHSHPINRVSQRLLYQDGLPVDLIPFGGVEENGEIAWPPSRDEVLNVSGFKDALASAIRVQVDADLVVPVVSLAGLAVLKLMAWAARKHETNKDADDLRRLLKDYGNAGNADRLYGEELNVLEVAKFDFDIAGARLLGRDVARIVSPETGRRITSIMESSEQLNHLLTQMLQTSIVLDEQAPKQCAELLESFRQGFLKA